MPDPSDWTPLQPGAGWNDEAGPSIPLPADLAGLAWLQDVSGYGQRGLPEGRARSGSFGVGNGRVFSLLGLDDPWSTFTNAVGPGYDRGEGFFGDLTLRVRLGPEEDALSADEEAVQRPRGSAVVRTWARGGGLAWSTTDVAPPGEDLILRHVTLWNEGDEALTPTLSLSVARAEDESLLPGDALAQWRGSRLLRVSCPGGRVPEAAPDTLEVDLGSLAPGEERSLVCALAFSEGERALGPVPDARRALEASHAAVQDFLAEGAVFDLADPKAEDLLEGLLVTLFVQTAETGVVSPMNRYTRGWMRDTEGPVRLYLRTGHDARALATLEALYAAQLADASISNSFPAVFARAASPEDPESFWARVPFLSGRNPAEAPSYVPILHAMASAFTGATWDAERRAWLEACLDRQVPGGAEGHVIEIGSEDLLPFSGDETYRWPMALALGEGLPEDVGWSLGSTILARAAAAALGRRPETWPADAFWSAGFYAPILRYEGLSTVERPYEDPSLFPSWFPGAGLPPERVLANLETLLQVLLREDGTLLSRLPTGDAENLGYTGMVPGYLLTALSRAGRPEADLAFGALDLVATPSGHFEEIHGPDNLPLAALHEAHGLGGDVSARYRPWEGGDVGAALIDHILGLEPDLPAGRVSLAPRLPQGWDHLAASGLALGERSLELSLQGYKEGIVLDLAGLEGLTVTLRLQGARAFDVVRVGDEVLDVEGEAPRLLLDPAGARVRVVARYED
jgi:hypothetical protein